MQNFCMAYVRSAIEAVIEGRWEDVPVYVQILSFSAPSDEKAPYASRERAKFQEVVLVMQAAYDSRPTGGAAPWWADRDEEEAAS
jgi:hypothetical protein